MEDLTRTQYIQIAPDDLSGGNSVHDVIAVV